MSTEKVFLIKFLVKDGNIVTKASSKNLAPHEIVGLLEVAKQQVLDGLKQQKKEVFQGSVDG